MDKEGITNCFLFFLIILILVFAVCLVIDFIADGYAQQDCQVLGYDDGTSRFFQHLDICWNVVSHTQHEKREYFLLDK